MIGQTDTFVVRDGGCGEAEDLKVPTGSKGFVIGKGVGEKTRG